MQSVITKKDNIIDDNVSPIDTETFSSQCVSAITKYDLDYIINTDQMGCEFRVNIK